MGYQLMVYQWFIPINGFSISWIYQLMDFPITYPTFSWIFIYVSNISNGNHGPKYPIIMVFQLMDIYIMLVYHWYIWIYNGFSINVGYTMIYQLMDLPISIFIYPMFSWVYQLV